MPVATPWSWFSCNDLVASSRELLSLQHFPTVHEAQRCNHKLYCTGYLTSSSILLNSSKQAQAPDCASPLKNFPMAL